MKKIFTTITFVLFALCTAQVTPNINTGNPNFPFPQFKGYVGGSTTLAQKTPVGVPHAELEQRSRDAYSILCNNMTYDINQGTSARTPLTVNGVRYIMPNDKVSINHCTCAEGDGYYLLAAAYMADKQTFDGYYMYIHDRQFQKTTRFVDNVVNSPDYAFSPGISGAASTGGQTNVYGGGLSGNSAADADVDIAMALLVAWKQWGDNALICSDPELGPITYKNEAIKYIKTLADTSLFAPALPIKKYVTGIIGLDGYMKSGDSWPETTTWAENGYLGMKPATTSGSNNYVDYHAPAYFHAFAKTLQAENQSSPWAIEQYKRGETSSDWVMGQAYAQGLIPWIGRYEVAANNTVTFSNSNMGEDFRYGWRTILNHLWNGAPTHTWNPTTHQYEVGTNTYHKDMALRFAKLLHHPEDFGNDCFGDSRSDVKYGGTSNVKSDYDMNGIAQNPFILNWPMGVGSPSAVVSGNWDLMAQMFRQCVTEFDDMGNSTQRYLTANPMYTQEWFRLLGMLVLTGNLHDPTQMQPTANMKVYKAVNKTFAFVGDTLQYTISYRNYGKPDATSTVVRDTLPLGLAYVAGSSSKTILSVGRTLVWTLGTVKGTNAGSSALTQDSITFKVVVQSNATSKVTNQASITCGNGSGWKSNEYPNRVTDVMERNFVDVIGKEAVDVRTYVSKQNPIPGDTLIHTVVVKSGKNTTLSGGRPGVVVAGAHDGLSASQPQLSLKYRIYHGAHEPYINYKNYRISYFLNEVNSASFQTSHDLYEGLAVQQSFAFQKLPQGAMWNQMLTLSFPSQKVSITPKLEFYRGSLNFIHEGALVALRVKSRFYLTTFANLNLTNDWSAESIGNVGDDHAYLPIANDFTDPLLGNQLVTKVHPNQCGTVANTLKKQLVEEWDGYTWRKIYGDAPIGLLTLKNVATIDTIPAGQTFVGFVQGFIQGAVSNGLVSWPKISQLAATDSVVYKFKTVVDQVTGISDASSISSFHVFPNPSEHTFVLQGMGDFSYHIFDSKGLSLEQGSGSNTLTFGQNLRAGLYILKVETAHKTEYLKIEKK